MAAQQLETISHAFIRLEQGRHPLEADPAVDARWKLMVAENPRLFDGETVLGTELSIGNGRLEAICRQIRFAGLMHFLKQPEEIAAAMAYRHIYAWPALISADGFAIMGRMAAHTANAGRIYFPSGSLEESDFDDGIANLEANIARELAEETGIDLMKAQMAPDWLLWRSARTAALIKVCRFNMDAKSMIGQSREFQARTGEDELDGLLAFAPGEIHVAMALPAKAFMAQFAG